MSGTLRQLPASTGEATVLAFGPWLKNTACLLQGSRVQWSPLHGDLGDPENCTALEHSVEAMLAQPDLHVDALAHDLHPDFFSTHLALQAADRLGVPAIAVQHHHAHIAAVCAEFGLREPVVGLALDGVGLGTDGVAWGGELLWVDGAEWTRLGHLQTLALPGGDTAAREPWRMAASVLDALGRNQDIPARFESHVGAVAARTVQAMLTRRLNCPLTTGAGRWFDAAAGALGVSVRQACEAEATIALERLAAGYLAEHEAPRQSDLYVIGSKGVLDLRPLVECLFALADNGSPTDAACGAALFHVTLSDALGEWAAQAAAERGVTTIALGGGCFFNRILTSRLRSDLERRGFRVQVPQAVSCGDAGLALGQAWVAACALQAGTKERSLCV